MTKDELYYCIDTADIAKAINRRFNGRITHKSQSRSVYIKLKGIQVDGKDYTIRISDHPAFVGRSCDSDLNIVLTSYNSLVLECAYDLLNLDLIFKRTDDYLEMQANIISAVINTLAEIEKYSDEYCEFSLKKVKKGCIL